MKQTRDDLKLSHSFLLFTNVQARL